MDRWKVSVPSGVPAVGVGDGVVVFVGDGVGMVVLVGVGVVVFVGVGVVVFVGVGDGVFVGVGVGVGVPDPSGISARNEVTVAVPPWVRKRIPQNPLLKELSLTVAIQPGGSDPEEAHAFAVRVEPTTRK